jgi:hypothetical protein
MERLATLAAALERILLQAISSFLRGKHGKLAEGIVVGFSLGLG